MKINKTLKPRFIAILILPFVLAVSVVLTYLDFERRETAATSNISSQVNNVYNKAFSILNQFYWDSVDTTIRVTFQGVQKGLFKENISSADNQQLNQIFKHSFLMNQSVNQIRWIDKNGLERFRMNRTTTKGNVDNTAVVDTAQLQDKSERYYFTETKQLASGYLYLSKLDLNIENNVIVTPYQPTIRVATPIRNENNQFQGIIIINFNFNTVFQKFNQTTEAGIDIDLFNDQGGLRYSSRFPKSAFLDLLQNDVLNKKMNIMEAFYQKREEFEDARAATRDKNDFTAVRKVDYAPQIRADEDIFLLVKAQQQHTDMVFKNNLYESLIIGFITFALGLVLLLLIHRSDKKIIELNSALSEQLKISEKSREFKSQFLANMSHEIRTPMTAISGLLELLLKEDLDDKIFKRLSIIKDSSDGLRRIINDILDLSKIESGKSVLSATEFRPSITIERCLSTFNGSANLSGSELILDMDPSLFFYYCHGDEYRIEQIINNLLSNAIKFSNGKPVRLYVTSNTQSDDNLELTVSVVDEGIGMSDNLIKKLGEDFTQADNTISKDNSGTGLGLSISKELLRSMGSELKIHSQVGQGSEFSFTLSLKVLKRESIFDNKKIDIYELNVWIINKENRNSDFINKLFQHWGCNATAISTPEDFSKTLDELMSSDSPLDFIIFDLENPVGKDDVQKVIERFKKEQLAKTKLVLMTSYEEKRHQYQDSDAQIHVIQKPVTVSNFLELLQTLNLVPNIQYIESSSNSEIRLLESEIKQRVEQQGMPKILLVEDNLTNQSVISEIFRSIDIEVTVANHGLEAVEMLESSQFDMIFMDIQMPIMDGLEATRVIRRENPIESLPIIALSAGVTEQEFYKSNEVGMNTHVPKPIDLKKLMKVVLEFWPEQDNPLAPNLASPENTTPLNSQTIEPSPAQDTSDTINSNSLTLEELNELERFDLSNTVYIWLGKDSYLKVLASFLTEYEKLNLTSDALTHKEKSEFVHKIKGVSGNLGAMALFSSCEAYEAKLREEDTSIDGLIQEIIEDIRTLQQITQVE